YRLTATEYKEKEKRKHEDLFANHRDRFGCLLISLRHTILQALEFYHLVRDERSGLLQRILIVKKFTNRTVTT
ncbi:jg3656, partial [Pararge aegeria aegeria]